MQNQNNENIVNLNLEDGIAYKMYVPYKDTDFIQGLVAREHKPYEYDMLQDIVARVPKGSTVLDVGMNIGNHSLFFLANGLKVIAFEANQKMSAIAKESVRLNGFEKDITIYECGVSDKEENAYFASEDIYNYGGMSLTVLEDSAFRATGGGVVNSHPNSHSNSTQKLEILHLKTIDSFNIKEKISLIKIDIESMESKALLGAKKLIEKNRPLIYVEANYVHDFVKIDRVLQDYNYTQWDIFGDSPTHFYVPRESLSAEQMLSKSLSNSALLRIYFTGYKHSTFIHDRLDAILHESINIKRDLNWQQNAVVRSLKNDLAKLKNTLSFRWGNAIIKSSKSLCAFLKLPYTLIAEYRAFKKQRKEVQQTSKEDCFK